MTNKIGVITSGGDAPGMNSCLKTVVDIATKRGLEVIAFKRGYNGLVDNNWQKLTPEDVKLIFSIGGSMIYAGRSISFREYEGKLKAVENLQKLGIDALVILGGDGTIKGANELSKFGIKCYVIPV
ncbi:MAG: 6-phosphofructokinase, partial [Clostridia bacterium]|nr:6-phosphofructokinase [Clostridia bacterium]